VLMARPYMSSRVGLFVAIPIAAVVGILVLGVLVLVIAFLFLLPQGAAMRPPRARSCCAASSPGPSTARSPSLPSSPRRCPGTRRPSTSPWGRRPVHRPRRGSQRPGQRPHHQGPRLPQRHRPDQRDQLRPRRPVPRSTPRTNHQPIPESRGEPGLGCGDPLVV